MVEPVSHDLSWIHPSLLVHDTINWPDGCTWQSSVAVDLMDGTWHRQIDVAADLAASLSLGLGGVGMHQPVPRVSGHSVHREKTTTRGWSKFDAKSTERFETKFLIWNSLLWSLLPMGPRNVSSKARPFNMFSVLWCCYNCVSYVYTVKTKYLLVWKSATPCKPVWVWLYPKAGWS